MIPIVYNIRNLRQRPVSTLTTALGMALVVTVFIAMSALSRGFRAALVQTGSQDNVLVLRKGANSELSSGLGRDAASTLAAMSFVARGADGQPLISPEVYVVVNLQRLTGGMANVVARGVNLRAFDVRKGLRITEGRLFQPGASEIVVGKTIVPRFANLRVGDSVTFASRQWAVVGTFEANGSAFESEIWGENEQFMPAFRGQAFQSITFRMADPAGFDEVKRVLEGDQRLGVDAKREHAFYADQSGMLYQVLNFIGVFVASIMAVGAVFGAVNTMYAAVSSRAPEIAMLLTIGFRPMAVLTSFIIESALIAVIAGLLGGLLSLPINGIVTSTTNWASFSEIAFAFLITPDLLVSGLIFAVVMGVLGGFFPAWRAARQEIVVALREA